MKLKTKQLIFYILFVFVMLGVGLCYYNSYVNETFISDLKRKKKECRKNCESDTQKGNKITCKGRCDKIK